MTASSIFRLPANVTVPASDVRDFAIVNGIPVGSRGRFSAELISAFNKANHRKYSEGLYVEKTPAKVRDGRGRKAIRHFDTAEVRRVLVEYGLAKPGRGRLPKDAYEIYTEILRNRKS